MIISFSSIVCVSAGAPSGIAISDWLYDFKARFLPSPNYSIKRLISWLFPRFTNAHYGININCYICTIYVTFDILYNPINNWTNMSWNCTAYFSDTRATALLLTERVIVWCVYSAHACSFNSWSDYSLGHFCPNFQNRIRKIISGFV